MNHSSSYYNIPFWFVKKKINKIILSPIFLSPSKVNFSFKYKYFEGNQLSILVPPISFTLLENWLFYLSTKTSLVNDKILRVCTRQ